MNRQPTARRLARKIEEYALRDGTAVKIYVKRAADENRDDGPLTLYFRCQVGDSWVTYVVLITDGLRAVLHAKGTSDEKVIHVAKKYVKHEISRGNLADGTELEFGALQEELFPAT